MPKYLFRATYTKEGLAGVLNDGGSARRDVAEQLIASLGGTLEAFYFAVGGRDVLLICDMPDDAASVAATATVTASGAMTVAETTPVITPEQVDAAAQLSASYRPPGS